MSNQVITDADHVASRNKNPVHVTVFGNAFGFLPMFYSDDESCEGFSECEHELEEEPEEEEEYFIE
jgi:hypothetical protein